MNISEKFYNDFGNKLLTDFAYGNLRILNAIKFVLNNINDSHKIALDIGCGIGWTSYEIARNFTGMQVDAIDLSKNSIKIAKKLFNSSNLSYSYLDITSKEFQNLNRKYDLVVLIDVFEHILDSDRALFLETLFNCLTDKSEIILTCPSPEHQQWLRLNSPSTMQPVDEKIDFNIILDSAKTLKCNIKLFEYKDIWYYNDYIYCVYQKNVLFEKKPIIKRKFRILDFNQRKKLLIKNNLHENLDWKFIAKLRRNDYPKETKKMIINILKRAIGRLHYL
jgi:SAM-dependent methyltransferase